MIKYWIKSFCRQVDEWVWCHILIRGVTIVLVCNLTFVHSWSMSNSCGLNKWLSRGLILVVWSLNVMMPFLKGTDHTKKFLIIDLVILFHWGEGLGYEGTGVLVTIDVELCQDCSWCPFWCVAFNLEGFHLVGHHKHWFFSESFLHFIERCLCIVIPDKRLVFLEELIERLR